MAFPWLSEANFETGASTYDSETDTDAKLAVEHYTSAGVYGKRVTPWRGAYVLHCDLSGGANDAFIAETSDFDLSADGTIHVRFYFLAKDLTMAVNDIFTIFVLDSAGPVQEVSVNIQRTSAGYRIVAGELGTSATVATSLIQNKWHAIEFSANIDSGADDGTLDFFVDGYQVGAQITGLDQAVITQARVGAMNIDAGTTAGHLYFDSIIADDARVYPVKERWPYQKIITKTEHLFVGPGTVNGAALLSTTAGNTCYLFDTDEANSTAEVDRVVELAVGANTAIGDPIEFQRGCYAVLAGTNPRAQIFFDMSNSQGEAGGPVYYGSDAMVLNYAAARTKRAMNVG